MKDLTKRDEELKRIADALERLGRRLAGEARSEPDFNAASGFVWHADGEWLQPVPEIAHLPLALLKGIDDQKETLLTNTTRFARGYASNNALLWGARGMGKSSLVKSVHGAVSAEVKSTFDGDSSRLKIIEIHREEIASLPQCLALLRTSAHRFIVFCDDLSFDGDDTSYKSLKAVLEGGIEGRPANVIFYATSNRRHLMPREMMENERSNAIHPSEAVNEKVSLSDRFGLWLGFHNCHQDDYLDMVRAYVDYFELGEYSDDIAASALEWSVTRGGRSGRVAWQFIQELAGEMGMSVEKN